MTRNERRRRRNLMLGTVICLLLFLLCFLLAIRVSAAKEAKPSPELIPTTEPIVVVCGGNVEAQEPETLEDSENELIEQALLQNSTRIDNVMVTHYCTCARCCGKSDGITASGKQAVPYVTVAVDPRVIPLGADVLIDYGDGKIHYCKAEDTGGVIKGNKIDLCVSTHEEALQLGIKTATVWWYSE